MARITLDIHWNPPSNLRVWRFSVNKHGSGVGDGFEEPIAHVGNYATFYGAEIARSLPDRDVYIINISKGSTNLCQWFKSAEPINMWTAIVGNVTEAINQIPGGTYIDEIIWWGHESDASANADKSATQFRDDFLKVIEQIDSQPWVAVDKPRVRLHRVHPQCNGLAEQINFGLELIVQSNAERFVFSDTTNLVYTDSVHLDPDQKELAASQVLNTPTLTLADLHRPSQENLLRNHKVLSTNGSNQAMLTSPDQHTYGYWYAMHPHTRFDVIDHIVHLKKGSALAQKIPSPKLPGQVVTISMDNVTTDLKIQIENESATVTAGEGRRQASFRLPGTRKQFLVVSIATVDGMAGYFSGVKLENGGAYTASSSATHFFVTRQIQRVRRFMSSL